MLHLQLHLLEGHLLDLPESCVDMQLFPKASSNTGMHILFHMTFSSIAFVGSKFSIALVSSLFVY